MTKSVKNLTLFAAAIAAGVGGLLWSGELTLNTGASLVTEAQASQ